MIRYVYDDLFSTDCDIISHGCNCVGGYGSGVALAVATRYPKAKQYYLDKYTNEGWELGDVQYVKQWDGRIIANCATQYNYLPRGECHFSYDAMKEVMNKLLILAKEGFTIAMPKIGSHLAGGDWDKIEKIINDLSGDTEICVYVLPEKTN